MCGRRSQGPNARQHRRETQRTPPVPASGEHQNWQRSKAWSQPCSEAPAGTLRCGAVAACEDDPAMLPQTGRSTLDVRAEAGRRRNSRENLRG